MFLFRNICFIGLPYSGKSTYGKHLSSVFPYGFIETDKMIQYKYNKSLPTIIQETSDHSFISTESSIIQSLHVSKSIISTGGSTVYEPLSMYHLQTHLSSIIIHLYMPFDEFKIRSDCFKERGIINPNNHSLENFYDERIKLYETYQDIIIDISQKQNIDSIIHEIIDKNQLNNVTLGKQPYSL